MLSAFSAHIKHPEIEKVHQEIQEAIALVIDKHEGNPYMGVVSDRLSAIMANAAIMPLCAAIDAIDEYHENNGGDDG